MQDFYSTPNSTHQIGQSPHGSPPFSLRFGQTKRADQLAVADEEGYITFINTRLPKDELDGTHKYSWMCHRNAIFDMAFADGDDLLATASGDQTIRVWDLSRTHPELKYTLRGHGGSVKAVQFRPGSQCELVSGAREGTMLLWDTRNPNGGQVMGIGSRASVQSRVAGSPHTIEPQQAILGAHMRMREDGSSNGGGSSSGKNDRSKSKGAQSAGSVTSVVFIDEHCLATAGANDGVVKMWDLRKPFASNGQSTPVKSFLSREACATGRARGISSLSLDSTKTKLLVSSADHHIYIFNTVVPEQEPNIFSGHHNSFYVKSSFSPDGRFIVSGSSDFYVYMWHTDNPLLPPIRLQGHSGEVSDVKWCPTTMCTLASSSDDTTVRIWNMERGLGKHADKYDSHAATGQAEVPESWSQASLRSVDDSLVCDETMIMSNTHTTAHTPNPNGPSFASPASSAPGGAFAASPNMPSGAFASPPMRFGVLPSGAFVLPNMHTPSGQPAQCFNADVDAGYSAQVLAGITTSPGPLSPHHRDGGGGAGCGAFRRGGSESPGKMKQARLDQLWSPKAPPCLTGGSGGGEGLAVMMTHNLKQTRISDMFKPVPTRLMVQGAGVEAWGFGKGGDEAVDTTMTDIDETVQGGGELEEGGRGVLGQAGSALGYKRKSRDN